MSLVDATMKRLRDLRRGLESDVARAICTTHPLSPAYRESLSVALRARADQLWLDLCGVFVGLESEAALRQAWSISPSSAAWTGLLYSVALRRSAAMRAEAMRLLALCPELSHARDRILSRNSHGIESLGYWLLADEPKGRTPTPDVGLFTSLRPQWRLRFCLASAVARGESLAQLFRRAAAQPSVSDGYRRTEFLMALHANRSKTGTTSRLTVIQADIAIRAVTEYQAMDGSEIEKRMTVRGRGGTDFRPVFAWLTDHAPDALLLYATDGLGSFSEPPPANAVIWLLTGGDSGKIPFGSVVKL